MTTWNGIEMPDVVPIRFAGGESDLALFRPNGSGITHQYRKRAGCTKTDTIMRIQATSSTGKEASDSDPANWIRPDSGWLLAVMAIMDQGRIWRVYWDHLTRRI